jgi:glycosyltransferase involved in cell wall biosynthesis
MVKYFYSQMPDRPVADLSIIAANYNNASYLVAFLESVNQSGMHPKELIIVDDGSTDHSRDILRSFSHISFLRTIFFETNRGFTTALNTALEAATGKYIMRADPDDMIKPERIRKQWEYLEKSQNIDVLGSNATYFESSTGSEINDSNFPPAYLSIKRAYQKGEHGVLHATVCAKADIYKRYRYQAFSPGEDYELFARMIRDGVRFENLPESLYLVRVHTGSSTSNISYEAIARTFSFRDEIFGTKTGKARIWFYYNYIRFYRKYQLSENLFLKYAYLFLAIICYPTKLLKRAIKR